MHPIEQKILNKFKREPHREISTNEIVREVHQEIYSNLTEQLSGEDKKRSLQAKRKKGQLHRKTLYHLNNLIREGVLKVSSVKGKGEKYFAITIDEGELVFSKKNKQIRITKNTISTSLIEEYEKKGIIYKLDPENWIGKINCILLDSKMEQGINKLYSTIYNCFSNINDCIGLNNFEEAIQQNTTENNREIIQRMNVDTKDHDRIISITINISNIKEKEKVRDFIKDFASVNPKNMNLVLRGDSKELKDHTSLMKQVAEEFSREKIKLNFQNTRVHEAPIIIGKAGTYTIRDKEWRDAKDNTAIAISNLTLSIDVEKAYSDNMSSHEFRELINRSAITLLKAGNNQSRRGDESLKHITITNKAGGSKAFYKHQKCYIRFWNYDLRDNKQKSFPDLIESMNSSIREFCRKEMEIYNACGLPIQLDIVLSSVFNKVNNNLSVRKYSKTTVRSFKDFQNQDVLYFIQMKERMAKLFEGGDRARFFRKGDFKPEEYSREISYLLNSYELPLITYDFKETKREMKLTNFIQTDEE